MTEKYFWKPEPDTGIPAGILMELYALKLKKIRALLVKIIGSSNFNKFLGAVKSINYTI